MKIKILSLCILSFLFHTAIAQTAASSAASAAFQTAEPSATAHDLKALELQFQEKMLDLRKETLDSQQETIAWWLGWIALLGVILPTVFYWRERSKMLEDLNKSIHQAKEYAEKTENCKQEAETFLDEIKKQHKAAADYTAQIKKMSGFKSEPDNSAEQQAAVQAAKDLQDNRDIPLSEQLRAHAIVLSDQARNYTEYEQAFYAWQAVIQHSPNDADAFFQAAYHAQQAYESGSREQQSVWLPHIEQGYRQALSIQPDDYQAANNWGSALDDEARALAENNRLDDALNQWQLACEKYQLALNLKPDHYSAAYNWGNALDYEARALAENNRLDDALNQWQFAHEKYRQALKLKPDYYQAAHNSLNTFICEYHVLLPAQPSAAQAKLAEAQTFAEDFLRDYPQYAPELAYNRACLFALLGGSVEKVVEQLKLSVSASNFPPKRHIEQDKDLDAVRDSEAFQTWFRQQFPD